MSDKTNVSSGVVVNHEIDKVSVLIKVCRMKNERIARLEAALKPFADCVYNDNGEMTVESTAAKYEHFCDAYIVLRKK